MNKINSNFLYRLIVPKSIRTLVWKNYLQKKILSHYENSKDQEISDLVNNIKENGLKIISSKLKGDYNQEQINVNYDEENKMKFVDFDINKRIYFKKNWSKKRIQKAFNQLLIEQDENSPHRYLTEKFNVDDKTIVADIGCAEANFSLDIVDKVKHIYLFETNNVWEQPLKFTFEKYKDKVTIVNKKFSNVDSESSVNGCKFLKDKGVNFIKIDVDGYENEVMSNINEMIKNSNDMKVALCTYHAQEDYNKYSKILRSFGFEVTSSKSYMIFYWDKNLKFPFLRRGLIRAKK